MSRNLKRGNSRAGEGGAGEKHLLVMLLVVLILSPEKCGLRKKKGYSFFFTVFDTNKDTDEHSINHNKLKSN